MQTSRTTAGLASSENDLVVEVGPQLTFETAWSSNAVSILQSASTSLGDSVRRLERSRVYKVSTVAPVNAEQKTLLLAGIHDRMTEMVYSEPLSSFNTGREPEPVTKVYIVDEADVKGTGRDAMVEANSSLGLGMDAWDIDYYTDIFTKLGRNPTSVECFDVGQSNSEHSRHWFFGGKLVIDGEEIDDSLFKMVKDTLTKTNGHIDAGGNSVIAFADNSSSMTGFSVDVVKPSQPGAPSTYTTENVNLDICYTAETHNFPTGVAPFPGAETGIGGRLRDQHSTGAGSLVGFGTAGYCVGNLNIPGYELPWEDKEYEYPSNLASPLKIVVDASNGASEYGNKFGEPICSGFCRSFGLDVPEGDAGDKSRREWVKPIMFTGGMGSMYAGHRVKGIAEDGMRVVKLGGPAYRIGMGGGAASSMVQGDNKAELDFNAVQRGDGEMLQRLNRVIKACCEMGDANPIIAIHDQGAGGNCNVLKEIVAPTGGVIELRDLISGDPTLSCLELWGAEYQENDAMLVAEKDIERLKQLCARERCPMSVVGLVKEAPEGEKARIVVHDASDDSYPVDLELDAVLGKMPQKSFVDNHVALCGSQELPEMASTLEHVELVLRLLSVGSKRFLTNKVDRSVSGLVAQQQCVGPLGLPLADCAVLAQSHLSHTGAVSAIGEQPIKGLLDQAKMARLSVAEMLTNMVWARVTALKDVKTEGNWMWAAKLAGEAANMLDACTAMCATMVDLGIAVDGGKDSLSMAAKLPGGGAPIKAPGSLVVSGYCTCPDVRDTVTPDLKGIGNAIASTLLFVPLGPNGEYALGGSALVHTMGQVGGPGGCPDLHSSQRLKDAFEVTQVLLAEHKVLAGHDVSDGGLVVAVLEMAFAGNCGVSVDLSTVPEAESNTIGVLFSEAPGLVLEVANDVLTDVLAQYTASNVECVVIGTPTARSEQDVTFKVGAQEVFSTEMSHLRGVWEATSFELEMRQCETGCVALERDGLATRKSPQYSFGFPLAATDPSAMGSGPAIAVLREEGSNGDREMAAAFHMSGCQATDVSMSDLLSGSMELSQFRGIVFVGGFSYADVFDAGRGWAAAIRHNPSLKAQFEAFKNREDTFSLGVCNGCQLMGQLGWVTGVDQTPVTFKRNQSGRFESRFSTVKIPESKSILLKGMEGSCLGVWVAHGEGCATFSTDQSQLVEAERCQQNGLVALQYADDDAATTDQYPFCPNGSPLGIAGLCSEDGRHLALMPHPERATIPWQWAYLPKDMEEKCDQAGGVAPWMQMFQNAAEWCKNV
eukprot:TRINITY_DN12864_c0_g1_i2.p1 TRINITY_DN12864_c0_g1~~TRINITY_DN12864_c0_g1_i2.p1  ORF type:complete len:1277 (+),score=348.04 TRINITY_DN12864_c0_g1_i2:360-4190(+)